MTRCIAGCEKGMGELCDMKDCNNNQQEVTTMSMSQILEVEKRNRYGSEYIYPLNEQAQRACALLNNQKSLTAQNIERLKDMGFIIKQVMTANGKQMEVGEL